MVREGWVANQNGMARTRMGGELHQPVAGLLPVAQHADIGSPGGFVAARTRAGHMLGAVGKAGELGGQKNTNQDGTFAERTFIVKQVA